MDPIVAPSPDCARSLLLGEGKLAEQIARQLEHEIVTAGWPVGQRLGNEEALVQRFGVSRWVVREAIAITERDGMTQRLRGRLGGVVVAAPAADVVAVAMRNYLLFVGIRCRHLMDAFRVLERLVFERVAQRLDETSRETLQALLAEPPAQADAYEVVLHTERAYRGLLQLARDPALQVFTLATSHLLVAWSVYLDSGASASHAIETMAHRTWRLRRGQIEAMLQGDAALAMELGRTLGHEWLGLMEAHEQRVASHSPLLALAEAEHVAEQLAALSDPPRASKRVDTLTLQLQHTILASGLLPGDALAPESELLMRYGVGRGVLREAIRSLERHGFVRAVEGRHGGLRVGQPAPGQTVRAAVLYFTFLKLDAGDLQQLAAALEDAALVLCVRAGHDAPALERLQQALAPEVLASDIGLHMLARRYNRGLAMATGNPLFQLMMGILGSLYTVGDAVAGPDDPNIRAIWLETARAVVAALLQGDAGQARVRHQRLRDLGDLFCFRRRTVEELLQQA